MREILGRRPRATPDAMLALGVYVHRLRPAIAAMAASLGGSTPSCSRAGSASAAPAVRGDGRGRAGVPRRRRWTTRANEAAGADVDTEIGAPDAGVRTFVIPAREDIEIARQVREVLGR